MAGNDQKLLSVIETTLALLEQFVSSISTTASTTPTDSNPPKSPLPLLLASAQSLKGHTTKLSLLAINSPFTPSAIITVLSEVNSSILPSLVTATLLILPTQYTESFKTEARVLVKNALNEFRTLVEDVKSIARKDGKNLSDEEKANITSTTGRVWKACDDTVKAATDGVVGFVIAKAEEYLELVKDGMRELEEWDPEEDEDDMWDDAFGGSDDDVSATRDETGEDHVGEDNAGEEGADMTAKLLEERKQLVRLLAPVSKMYTSMISNRLKRMEDKDVLPTYAPQLDKLVGCLGGIPDSLDEAAGSLYEHDISSVEANAAIIHSTAVSAVEIVKLPFPKRGNSVDAAAKDDMFSKWAGIWLNVLEEIRTPGASPKKIPSK